MARTAIATAVLMSLALPAQAHSTDELDAFFADWNQKATEAGGITLELLESHMDMRERHPHYWQPAPPPVTRPANRNATTRPGVFRGIGSNVEQWRGLVAAYFGSETERALCLIGKESGGNANALNASSGASGLLQIMPFWADHFGIPRSSLFDPETNIRIAKAIRDTQGWTAWSPYKRGECR